MVENLTCQASHRISGESSRLGQVSNPSATPGQNERFSDGFLTKSRAATPHSDQPGKTRAPKNPMKSQEIPSRKGLPPVPPFFGRRTIQFTFLSADFPNVRGFLPVSCSLRLEHKGGFALRFSISARRLSVRCRSDVHSGDFRNAESVSPTALWPAFVSVSTNPISLIWVFQSIERGLRRS